MSQSPAGHGVSLKQPAAAFLMHPVVMEEILRVDHLERLQRCCRFSTLTPLRNFDATHQQELHNLEVLITSWGAPAINASALAMMPRLKLIAHLAGSVKGFVDSQAWARGILVTNAVAANAVPVAEYSLAAILFANKKVLHLADYYRKHHANRAPWTREAPDVGNYRKRVGIIGASAVGRKLIELLRPFDFQVAVYDPYLAMPEAQQLGVERTDLSTLLRQSDVVTLHAPLLTETRMMLGAREFGLMRDHATFINTARGAIIDQEALIRELKTGRLFAVLDTTEPEVMPADSPLYRLPNVLLTPHIAGSLGNEVERLADYIVDEVERFCGGKPLHFAVAIETIHRLA